MRHPPAVFRSPSHFGEFLTPRDLLPNPKPFQTFYVKVPVQRKKLLCLPSEVCKRVPQNHYRPVIQRRSIICNRMHHAVERRAHRTSSLHVQINPKMNRAPFINGTPAPKLRRRINRTRLVVTAHADLNASAFHLRKNPPRRHRRVRHCRISAKQCAPHAEIENKARCTPQIEIEHRSRGLRISDQPFPQRFALWHRIKPASLAKSVERKPWMNLCQPRERFPRRPFANRHVSVVRFHASALRGIHHAHREPCANQRI